MSSPILKGSVLLRSPTGGESSLDADYIQFNTSYSDGITEGRLQWSSDEGTLEVGLPGGNVNLQIGQEVLARCRNNTGAQIDNGSVVYISGTHAQETPEISLARADTNSLTHVLGMATEDIADNSFGYVTTFGLVRNIDTLGFTEGDAIYLSETTAGAYQQNRPTGNNHAVHIGHVLKAHATEGVVICHLTGVSPTDLTGTDGFSYARYWDGSDYAWNSTPKFSDSVDIEGSTTTSIDLSYTGDSEDRIQITHTETADRLDFLIGKGSVAPTEIMSLAKESTTQLIHCVGIGTTAPDCAGLHIRASGSTDATTANGTLLPLVVQRDANCRIGVFAGATNQATLQFGGSAAGTGNYARVGTKNDTAKFFISVDNTDALTIDTSQNVGIGTDSPSVKLHLSNGAAARTQMYVDGAITDQFKINVNVDGTVALVNTHTTSRLYLSTNGTERLSILSGGDVGIGTSSPSGKFHVAAGTVTEPTYGAADAMILQGAAATNIYFNLVCDNTKKCGIRFSDDNLAPAQISYDHSTSDMAINVAGTTAFELRNDKAFAMEEVANIATKGAGWGSIWTKNDAPNVLMYTDDADVDTQVSMTEGTWTPTIMDDSNDGTGEGQVYTTQTGYYWKIGNLCYIYVDIHISNLGTLTTTQQAKIGGLPFAGDTFGNFTIPFGYGSSLAIGADETPVGRTQGTTSRILLEKWDLATGTSSLLISELSAGGKLIGSGFYKVA